MPTTGDMELFNASYVRESVFDETPTSPTMLELWQNVFTVRPTRAQLQSRRRTGDGRRSVGRLGRYVIQGEIEQELTYGNSDDLLEGLFGKEFPTAFSEISGITFSVTAATSTIADSGSGMGSVAAGDMIVTAGFSNAANNGVMIVSSASASAIVAYRIDGQSLVDESAGQSVTINEYVAVTDENTDYSYTFEGRHPDLGTPEYHVARGCVVDTLGLEANNEIAVARFGILGASFAPSGTSLGSPTLATEIEPMDSLSGSFTLGTYGSAAAASRMTNAQLNINRNRRLSRPLGQTTADEPFRGRCDVSGQFSVYGENDSLLDDWIAENKKHLIFTNADPSGNMYEWHVFYAFLTDVRKDEDEGALIYVCDYEGLRHPGFKKTVGCRKIAA